jgi:hypothetical protein
MNKENITKEYLLKRVGVFDANALNILMACGR